jgi:ribonuclease Z
MTLTILGCNGALPANGRFPTCQILDVGAEMFLIDCGEGAQIKMQQYKVRSNRVNQVFISHLHGDHFFGLIGWLNSQALLGREKELHIYANEKLKAIIAIQLEWQLPYQIIYHDLVPNESQILLDTDKYEVISFPVMHSVPTHGFRFTVKRNKRIMISDKVREYEVSQYFYKKLTLGFDYEKANGEIIKNEILTTKGKPNLVYAYCADTLYTETIVPYLQNSNLIYHEATYCNDQLDKATARMHSTAKQAANIAKLSNANQLVIGHYSSKYKDISGHLAEANAVFEHVVLAEEGLSIEVK